MKKENKMPTVFEKRGALIAQKVVENLKSRKFDAYFVENAKDAVEKAISLIPKGSVVSWGGSMTLVEIGMQERIYKEGFTVIDRDKAKDPQERAELSRKALLSDVYLTSTNAISQDGVLINTDGFGNRVAAMTFGPKSVIVIAGINKICKTLEEAYLRVKNHASPLNAARLSLTKTACASTGFCQDCKSDESVCSFTVQTRMSKVPGRMKVIIVGENLGY
ncbi:MAG: lactate utilization protein [Elusimicrobiota bacterium]|jgi:L-lactate utilization protein LutB|nr:lactate utilization protein [Elusimicrobiota bacterium]